MYMYIQNISLAWWLIYFVPLSLVDLEPLKLGLRTARKEPDRVSTYYWWSCSAGKFHLKNTIYKDKTAWVKIEKLTIYIYIYIY